MLYVLEEHHAKYSYLYYSYLKFYGGPDISTL